VERLGLQIDPYANDPGHWGASLLTLAELVVPCLDAAGARSVVEVGAYAGDLTRLLVDRAAAGGGRVQAIDPDPRR
jgi:16S rRNA A1518/A1519 N6-dimethyltransferase RsmA/KsgA/DIM1 with predicted DNA glycosylase/AP lyase activity